MREINHLNNCRLANIQTTGEPSNNFTPFNKLTSKKPTIVYLIQKRDIFLIIVNRINKCIFTVERQFF